MNKLTKLKNTSFHLENIFAVQCRLVGANYNEVDRTKKDWYLEYQWDEETEKQFEDWMVDYLHKLPKAHEITVYYEYTFGDQYSVQLFSEDGTSVRIFDYDKPVWKTVGELKMIFMLFNQE